ncbi:MAG: hypothetical protein AYP45_00405 [Candidatus Brocadia carolinensis]|uniref:MutL C-terminal dimerisation domain-containing protein n=1 Tax=Candidatus Brocadia carolinensis TaxID=1004156 RepID=A0A1V4AXZ1_9BACT|nr:MAG: hypothetical protein AYP45_00405 [Candidatus Brocadia caroliniensis]
MSRKKKVSFQIHNAFIVEETDDGINIIDQHALHEIILYHEIERNLHSSRSLSQRLLIPEMIELSPKDFFFHYQYKKNIWRNWELKLRNSGSAPS